MKLLDKFDCNNFVFYKKIVDNIVYSVKGIQNKKGYIHKFINYNEFSEEETQIPEDYKKIQISEKYREDFFCSNIRKRLLSDNDQYKQIKLLYGKYKIYTIHDNRGTPFIVYCNNSNIHIYKQNEQFYYINSSDFDNNLKNNYWMYIQYVTSFQPKKIFIGKSLKCKMTEELNTYNKNYDGNSILLHIDKLTYVLIQQNIISFKAQNEIIKFASPMGNNNVPYMYAIDKKDMYYLLSENMILTNVPNGSKKDPYTYYYSISCITTYGNNAQTEPLLHNTISKFFINNEQYSMAISHDPSKNYDRLIEYNDTMYIIKTDGKKYNLNKKKYVSIINNYIKKIGAIKLKTKILFES